MENYCEEIIEQFATIKPMLSEDNIRILTHFSNQCKYPNKVELLMSAAKLGVEHFEFSYKLPERPRADLIRSINNLIDHYRGNLLAPDDFDEVRDRLSRLYFAKSHAKQLRQNAPSGCEGNIAAINDYLRYSEDKLRKYIEAAIKK